MEGAASTSLPIEPLEGRESIEQRVARELRLLIVGGQLPEGMQLVGRDLAARFGVSQTPVRAALSQLQGEGFVAFGPTGRAFVSPLTREDFEEIYAMRFGLEGLAARLGAAALEDRHLDVMAEVLVDLQIAARKADVEAYLEGRWSFYGTCYGASGRTRLVADVERLHRRSERYNRVVLSSAERFQESFGRYEEFFQVCIERDGEAAERIVQASLRWAVAAASPSLRSEQDA